MKLVGKDKIKDCKDKHPDSRRPLDAWVKVIEAIESKNPAQLKQAIGTVSIVSPYTIFNVAGNKYRAVTVVNYETQTVLAKFVGSHKEYDKNKWK